MSRIESVFIPLADNQAIVLVAYIAAFLPWAAFDATDFIGEKWKTVRSTRRQGHFHLLWVMLPTGYILFYIWLQSISGDFKEMFAAIVALFFSILHIARTAFGIWQLKKYREWAVRSIHALETFGIKFKLQAATQEDTVDKDRDVEEVVEEVVDSLYVNDSIVDNQIFRGDTRCYLKLGSARNPGDGKQASIVSERISLLFSIFAVPLQWTISLFVGKLRNRPPKPVQMVPYRPVDLWMRWAVSFAAQGLSCWIRDFNVAKPPSDAENHLPENLQRHYHERRAYFAGEVLASAVLQTASENDDRKVVGAYNFLLWNTWALDSSFADGRVSKKELLEHAIRSGAAFPSEASHYTKLEKIRTKDGLGYDHFGERLARIAGNMPAKFGRDIASFDIEKLEWLAILLHIGCKFLEEKQLEDSTEYEPTESELYSDPEELDFDERDLPYENLRGQLGFRTCEMESCGPAELITTLSSFPMHRSQFKRLSEHNRLVLKAGEFVDIWLALVAGEQVKFLLKFDATWQERCLGQTFAGGSTTKLQEHSDCLEPSNRTLLLESHQALEEARLKAQFANEDHKYFHLDQTMTFMGYAMEFVRSELASWVQENGETQTEAWSPEIHFDLSNSFQSADWHEIPLSKTLCVELLGVNAAQFFQRKSFHVRLIYEIQKALQDNLLRNGNGPASPAAILLGVLAFPSLHVDAKLDDLNWEGHDVKVDEVGLQVSIEMQRHEYLERTALYIIPQCGPQSLQVAVRFQIREWNKLVALVGMRRNNDTDDGTFKWEWWRDSFLGRQQGLKSFQRKHEIPSPQIHIVNEPIGQGVKVRKANLTATGDELRYWSGWMPFRIEICKFELHKSPGFLREYKARKWWYNSAQGRVAADLFNDFSKESRLPVSYAEATREILEHSCLAVRELLYETDANMSLDIESLSSERIAEQLINHAKDLLTQGGNQAERAVFLLEVAAVEFGSEMGLRKCIELLINGEHMMRRVGKAVRVLENYIGAYCSKEGEKFCLPSASTDETVRTIHSLYGRLMNEHGYNTKVLISFAKFRDAQVSRDIHSFVEESHNTLRKTFLVTRNFYIIFELGLCFEPHMLASFHGRCLLDGSLNHRVSSYNLLHRESVGNLQEAFFKRAVDIEQNVEAAYELAILKERGIGGMPRNAREAVELYEMVIIRTEHKLYASAANNNLGNIFREGREGVVRDMERAVDMYESSIRHASHIHAMINLATLLRMGADGVERNVEKAVRLLERAIQEGREPVAMTMLGNLYIRGEGVPKDISVAAVLYNQALEVTSQPRTIEQVRLLASDDTDPDLISTLFAEMKARHLQSAAGSSAE